MIPVRISLAGFMSYKETQMLDFSSDSLWVLVGKNASGKTTIFDAIIFALFGKARVTGVTNADLINHNSDRAEITFDFASGGRLYRVQRTINKRGHVTRQAQELIADSQGSVRAVAIPNTHKDTGFDEWMDRDVGMSFEVFTSSVLLRQGKADALLEAGTETRYSILSRLIDISKYEALEERAKDQKKYWTAQSDAHIQNLRQLAPISENDLIRAQQAIDQEQQAAEVAGRNVDHLTNLFVKAGQWEMLECNRLEDIKRREETRALLRKESEIEECYGRWELLRAGLPGLKVVNDLHERIKAGRAAAGQLEGAIAQNAGPLAAANESQVQLSKEVHQLEQSVSALQDASRQTAGNLASLAPTMARLEQIDRTQQELEDDQRALEQFPADLEALLAHAEAERARLEAAAEASKDLARLLNERDSLKKLSKTHGEITESLANCTSRRGEMIQAQKAARRGLAEARKEEDGSRTALAQVDAHHQEAAEHLKELESVAGDAECRYCGAKLTPAHISREHARRKGKLAELTKERSAAASRHQAAEKSLEVANTQLESATKASSDLETQSQVAQRELETTEKRIKERVHALAMLYHELSAAYQAKVSPTVPQDEDEWLETRYPRSADLTILGHDIKQLPRQQGRLKELTEQKNQRNTVRALIAQKEKSQVQARKLLPAGWQAARARYTELISQKQQEENRLTAQSRALAAARQRLKETQQTAKELNEKQLHLASEHASVIHTLESDQLRLAQHIPDLPPLWQDEARALTTQRLNDLQVEEDRLKEYTDLHRQLAMASQTLTDLDARIQASTESIESLPTDARQPAKAFEAVLSEARLATRSAEQQHTTAQEFLKTLETGRAEYARVENELKTTQRKARLYGILTEQFGERGIQRVLINRAEVAIVAGANTLLDNLSGGRSKLRLRDVGGNHKALDLEVFDTKTGGDVPLLVGMASGSQRFRIAISLALAIGQYIGQESHRIESVIIDEGFGSLDVEGRESVIQELHNLRQHLKRILLVSHQEEFSKGFTTGYEIRIVDNASQVRLMVQR